MEPPSRLHRRTLAGQERKVAGVLPRSSQVRARLGYVELDLTQARFEPGVTTIDMRAFLGYFATKGAAGKEPSIVRITGRASLGFVETFLPGSG